jgi:hypothetical protein
MELLCRPEMQQPRQTQESEDDPYGPWTSQTLPDALPPQNAPEASRGAHGRPPAPANGNAATTHHLPAALQHPFSALRHRHHAKADDTAAVTMSDNGAVGGAARPLPPRLSISPVAALQSWQASPDRRRLDSGVLRNAGAILLTVIGIHALALSFESDLHGRCECHMWLCCILWFLAVPAVPIKSHNHLSARMLLTLAHSLCRLGSGRWPGVRRDVGWAQLCVGPGGSSAGPLDTMLAHLRGRAVIRKPGSRCAPLPAIAGALGGPAVGRHVGARRRATRKL